ncbi:hypothetical protein [Zavarzinia sp.]|uniref:hypothetical protein n=1 Tax=Zavarzinia sp. TaxID=2027920 RepID=UPI003BB62BB3
MKRWMIAVVALLLLAGLAVGGLYLGGFILAAPGADEAAAEAPPPATLPELPEAAYFEMKNVLLPAYRGGTFRNYIAFSFKVEVKDEATALLLRDRNAHMRSALMNDFSRQPIETRDGPADFDDTVFRARVLDALRRSAGDIDVRGVLIESVLPVKG